MGEQDSTRKGKILVLDGGMGTTLEQLGVDVSSSLWGSDLLLSDPAPIATVHRGYVEAGADLIESATYPLSVEGIQREYPGKTVNEAEGILHRGLQLAVDSCSSPTVKSGVVLALGPLGATLKPGAEYSGLYPGPYGFGTVLDSSPSSSNIAPSAEDDARAEEALYTFHRSRLEAYAQSPLWDQVEWVGFETIPLVREVKAIRRAIRDTRRGSGSRGPMYWVACTFPDGKAPQTDCTVADTIKALLNEGTAGGAAEGEGVGISLGQTKGSGSGEVGGREIDGVGINCTNPAWLPELIDTFNSTLRSLTTLDSPMTAMSDLPISSPDATSASTPASTETARSRPWFILYPDGGQVYDSLTRSWSKERLSAEEWAERMMAAIKQVESSGLWEGVVAGGCCKTSAEEIGELRRRVHQYQGGDQA